MGLLALLLSCSAPPATGLPSDTSLGPPMDHAPPGGGAMCFDCHLCATGGAPVIEPTHPVCATCHASPDGSVPSDLPFDCGCADLDCAADPPVLGCADCHDDGRNGIPSAADMNALCMACHQPAR